MLIYVVLRLFVLTCQDISCNLVHMTASSAPTSPLHRSGLEPCRQARSSPASPWSPGVAYAPVIRPGRLPVIDVLAELPSTSPRPTATAEAGAVHRGRGRGGRPAARPRRAMPPASASEVLAATAQLAQDRAWLGAAEKRITDGHARGAGDRRGRRAVRRPVHQDGRADGRAGDRPAGTSATASSPS